MLNNNRKGTPAVSETKEANITNEATDSRCLREAMKVLLHTPLTTSTVSRSNQIDCSATSFQKATTSGFHKKLLKS